MTCPTNNKDATEITEHGIQLDIDVTDKLGDKDECIETRCGVGACRPALLQNCNNPKFLCLCLCVFTFVQGFAVNGINNINTTSYERRFELTSSHVGWISSCFDISAAICGVVIGFYGNQRNKGRVLTIAFVISSLGSLCMYLPHFLTEPYQWGQGNAHVCSTTGLADTCTDKDAGLQYYMALFIVGQFMHGVGGSTLITVGFSFIDDSVPAESSPLYISIIGLFQMLGPMTGFLVGGALLDVYVDFESVPKKDWGLSPTDPRWVGAWWVGFVFSFLLMFICAMPFAIFGEELPSAKHIRETRISETHNDGRTASKSAARAAMSIQQFPVLLNRLLRNPAFICVAFSSAFMGLVTVSLGTFLPKYIQNIFGVSASSAALYAGLLIIPGAALGQIFGGFVLRRWKLKVQTILKFIITIVSLAVLSKACFLINCENGGYLVGLKNNHSSTFNTLSFTSGCNQDCHCDSSEYQVVCDKDGGKYFSPCLAGCRKSIDGKSFTDCACVMSTNNVTSVTLDNCTADTCNPLLYVFLMLTFISAFLVSTSTVPTVTVILRCAHQDERTFALGLLNFIARVIGTIPGPVLYGAVIDSSCDVWGNNCGHRTSCWLYNKSKMGGYLALLGIGFTSLSALFFILAYKLYKPPVERKSVSTEGRETDCINDVECDVLGGVVDCVRGGDVDDDYEEQLTNHETETSHL